MGEFDRKPFGDGNVAHDLAAIMIYTPVFNCNANKFCRLRHSSGNHHVGGKFWFADMLPKFRPEHECEIKSIVVGSGKALHLGRTGDVDSVWVHSPLAEKMSRSARQHLSRYWKRPV